VASLLRALTRGLTRQAPGPALSLETWSQMMTSFSFGGAPYATTGLTQTLPGESVEPIGNDLVAYATELRATNGVVYACTAVRQLVFSAVRFQYQMFRKGRPSELWGDPSLAQLESPWGPGSTTQDLLARTIQDVDLAGNAYWALLGGDLVRLRPDWVEIALAPRMHRGSQVGSRRIGYVYWEGGRYAGADPAVFTTDEVAHFAPDPDPLAWYRGQSWLRSVIPEVLSDRLMGSHKSRFFQNAATPNLSVSLDKDISLEAFKAFKDKMDLSHRGVENAYKTLYLGGGADVRVIGADFKQMDFKTIQGHGETRIAAAAGVPPIIVGLSEGLESATYSNYAQARRRFADGTMHPLWQNCAGSFSRLVRPPNGSRLHYDARGVPFLREDETDATAIQAQRASTLRTYIDSGHTPESARAALIAGDEDLLEHSGLFSVQRQPAGTPAPDPAAAPAVPPPARDFNPNQPRDPDGKWGDGIPGPSISIGGAKKITGGGKKAPLTDAEYEAHTKVIESKITAALKGGEATDSRYALDLDRGVWDPARARLHKEIVNDLFAQAADAPDDGKVVIAGGLGGAGKSTVLKTYAGVDQSQYLTLNPDDIKEEMAARGMIPKVEGLSPMETAALVHEESSHIASLLAKRAYAERKNVIWDITMASRGSVERRVQEMRAAGYDDLSAVFVDIPVETSVERALARHRRGMEDYRNGKGPGGRYVPPAIIRKNESSTASSANREVFDALRTANDFDHWSLYDNSGKAPVLLGEGGAPKPLTGETGDTLIKSIHDFGGFTFDPAKGGLINVGDVQAVAVAVPGTERLVGQGQNVDRDEFVRGVSDVIMAHGEELGRGAVLGGWYSEDRDAYMVELTELVPDREAAIKLGQERNQEGIFDLGTGEYISTGGTGDAGRSQRLVGKPHYNPHQPRDPNGKWGDGVAGPSAPKSPAPVPALTDLSPGLQTKIHAKLQGLTGQSDEELSRHAQANLLQTYREGDAARATWYAEEGADIADRAARYDISPEQLTGMVAVTSAQKRWVENKDLAEGIAAKLHADAPFELTQERLDNYNAWTGKRRGTDMVPHPEITPGTYRPSELPADLAASVTPDLPKHKNMSYIVSATRIYRGEETVDEAVLGPKQRSFVNNLLHPDDDRFVTVDTWHYRAMLGDTPITAKVGGTSYDYSLAQWADRDLARTDGRAASYGYDPAKPYTDKANMAAAIKATRDPQTFFQSGPAAKAEGYTYGTYPWFVEQTRIAADSLGVSPNAMQAVAWYAVGGGL
jgi:predicted ABC-type ATPase